MESSRFPETISLKAAFPKSLLVKNVENEEKLACSNRYFRSHGVFGFSSDYSAHLSQRRQRRRIPDRSRRLVQTGIRHYNSALPRWRRETNVHMVVHQQTRPSLRSKIPRLNRMVRLRPSASASKPRNLQSPTRSMELHLAWKIRKLVLRTWRKPLDGQHV